MPNENRPANKRRHGRVNCRDLETELGRVLDVSASGLRVQARGRCRLTVGTELDLELKFIKCTMPVRAQVVWVKKTGFRVYEAGLQFQGLSPEKKLELTKLAVESADSLVLGHAIK